MSSESVSASVTLYLLPFTTNVWPCAGAADPATSAQAGWGIAIATAHANATVMIAKITTLAPFFPHKAMHFMIAPFSDLARQLQLASLVTRYPTYLRT